MALALILNVSNETDGIRVRFDIGVNRFYRWQLGEESSSTHQGLPRVVDVAAQSDLLGPLSPATRGRGEFIIPRQQLDREHPYLQLLSYREADGTGPAVSKVVRLSVADIRQNAGDTATDPLPAPAGFALSRQYTKEQHAMTNVSNAYSTQVDNAPFQLRERKYSEPFFIEAILGALPTLAPMLAPAVGSLISGVAPAVGQVAGQLIRSITGGGGGGSGGGNSAQNNATTQVANLADQTLRAAGNSAQQLLTPENMRQIVALIQAARAPVAPAAAPTTSAAQSYMPQRAIRSKRARSFSVVTPSGKLRRHALGANRSKGLMARSKKRARPAEPKTVAHGLSHSNHYSQAQVVPLLAALPALMPLLRNVLSPQTVQSIIQAPERMTGQVINGIKDFARLGIEADNAHMQHLRELNPGVDDPALDQLLAGLSLSLSNSRYNYRRVASVRLEIPDVQTQVLFGRERALYKQGAQLQFPLIVTTPQTIPDAELLIQVKQADSLRIVHEQSERIGDVGNGPLPIDAVIDASITDQFRASSDYIVVLTLLWKNKGGARRGTSIQHSITMMSQYRFDRVDESGDLIPLSNRQQYRDYWHRIWESGFDSDTRRVELQSRYYLTLSPERNRNARLDSDVRNENDGPRKNVRIRSGYEYSLYALNHLLSRIDPNAQPLSDEMLEALNNEDFIERFNQAAQHQGRVRGRPGETAELWVYPEFKLQSLVMVVAENVNVNGNVTSLAEQHIQFPMPAMLHFVGVKQ